MPDHQLLCDTPQRAVEYWRTHIETAPDYRPDQECFAVLLQNTRMRVLGHHVVTLGLLDTVLVHPREVFRIAIVARAAGIICMHNHPSGDPLPSECDIRSTRDLVRAGQIIRIPINDHIIIGHGRHTSLRELGYVG
jgi:DNA repair protein RadC